MAAATIKKPGAVNDSVSTNEDTALNNIAVLSNDVVPAGMTATVVSLSGGGTKGTSADGAAISINPDGTISYDPTAKTAALIQALAQGETTTDTFTYTLKETNKGVSSLTTATVTVTLTGVNDPPTITGTLAGQTTTDTTAINPFGQVKVGDVDHNAKDSMTITLLDSSNHATDANGTLSGAGLSKTGIGTYTLAATSPTNLTSELNQLVFTPTAHQGSAGATVTTQFSLAANDGFTTTTDTTTSVVTTETLPNIVGYSLQILDVQSPIVANTFANDINDSGEVVGSYAVNVGAGLTQFTGFTDINGIINAVVVPGSFDTDVSNVNNKGDLIGTWDNGANQSNHGFVERAGSGVFTPLPEAFTDREVVQTVDINSAGTVVYFDQGPGVNGFAHTRSFSYDSAGNLNEIHPNTASTPDNTDTFVSAINDHNVIVGYFEDDLGVHGFINADGTSTTVDVPFAGAKQTLLTGVNNLGDAVGIYEDAANVDHAFIRSHTGDITAIPGWAAATSINDFGVVAGIITTNDIGAGNEVGVYINGRTINTTPNVTTAAYLGAINNSNQVAGYFSDNGTNYHGLVGTPVISS